MTEESPQEGDAEAVEDLEAPAQALADVHGGADACGVPSLVCAEPTCEATQVYCNRMSHNVVVHEQ
jgi:hypothetical protein